MRQPAAALLGRRPVALRPQRRHAGTLLMRRFASLVCSVRTRPVRGAARWRCAGTPLRVGGGGRRAARRRRLPRRRRDRDHRLPGRPARQAAAGRGPGRGRQDRAGQGGGRRRPAPGWSGCSATRASTRPARCTSGTTASSCCACRSTGTPARPAGTPSAAHIFSRGVPAGPAAADRDPAHRADRAAGRRDRQGRRRGRGPAAGGAVRLPGDHPGARHAGRARAARSWCSPRTPRAS